MKFTLRSKFKPTGDQPRAIEELVQGVLRGEKHQVLLGVTGSGKTFTIANVIERLQRPTLILSHNKTLTAQLYSEFKEFFPDNLVEYFVSYYDYYQPEAYLVETDTYIEKDLQINQEIDKLRLRAISALLSGRRDVIIVASVSCIYGMGNPEDYATSIIRLYRGRKYNLETFLYDLVNGLYYRTEGALEPASFRVRGDTVEVFPPYLDLAYRVSFWDDEVEELEVIKPDKGYVIETTQQVTIFPANIYIAPKDRLDTIVAQIEQDMYEQEKYFIREGRMEEARRIVERTRLDLEMIRELGYCNGIENYSRYFDGRKPGTRPFCLLDYFPDDYLMVIDESHVTIPQIRGMWGGDRARKLNLVHYGFRLPSALDNRPLNFEEFEALVNQVIYVSATPGAYELQKTGGVIVEQIVRPTGLLDPKIEVRPTANQIDDLLEEIRKRVEKSERVLVTTLTKRMAEELAKYLAKMNVRCKYLHSEIDTLDRVEILRDLRLGEFDVLVGVNLLREGLDLPEVSLVAILDADKEGFLRNERSLTQTAGRAARNANGMVIFYADHITESMQRTIDETERRRAIQMAYNREHQITPKTLYRSREEILNQRSILDVRGRKSRPTYRVEPPNTSRVAEDSSPQYHSAEEIEKQIRLLERKMKKAAKELDFLTAAKYRDDIALLKKKLKSAL